MIDNINLDGAQRVGTNTSYPIYNNRSGLDAAGARDQLWRQFQNNTVPTLREMENQLKTRRGDFVTQATDSANKARKMANQQQDISREALGISLTPEQQAAQDRLDVLGGASAMVSSQNEAVDVAEQINENQANALLNVQTGITQEALGDLQGAASLKDARESGDSNRKQQARASNTATAGTVLMLAAMMM